MADFERALNIILLSEGGYVNNKLDKGGETNYGITKKTAIAHGYMDSMKTIPLHVVSAIYKKAYWDIVRADEYQWPLNLFVFDMAVNSGPKNAITALQKSLKLSADGVFGPKTLAATKEAKIYEYIDFMEKRSDFFISIVRRNPTQIIFLSGWLRRLWHVFKAGISHIGV
jgi:lysozyme family protein